jgi:hypothetical protein
MSSNILNIGICHWDGYETNDNICSLVKGADIIKNRFGVSLIKIYAGNKYNKVYNDFGEMKSNNINTLKDLIKSGPYKSVLDLNFKTVVIVGFSINKNNDDDYWRVKGTNKSEITQFTELSEYLSNNYTETEFIISNWESDCVIDSIESVVYKKMCADNIVDLINTRAKACKDYSNVKIALEVNRYYEHIDNSISYVLPKVECDMISYSCYQMLYKPKDLYNTITRIKNLMKPTMELYIGEFGFPINQDKKTKVLKCIKSSIEVFVRHRIRLAFYWNLYCNEKMPNGTFNGFGIINPSGEISYVYEELFERKACILIRHGISLANIWKHKNNTKYIHKKDAMLYNLVDSDLSYEGIKAIRKKKEEFWDHVFNNNTKDITVYVSPMKRAIRTFCESINGLDKKYFSNINVIITPVISEYGRELSNKYSSLEAIKLFPEVEEIKSIVKDIKFVDYVEWTHIKKGQYDDKIKKYIVPNNNETVIFFCHWGVINHITGVNVKNFGIESFIVDYKHR